MTRHSDFINGIATEQIPIDVPDGYEFYKLTKCTAIFRKPWFSCFLHYLHKTIKLPYLEPQTVTCDACGGKGFLWLNKNSVIVPERQELCPYCNGHPQITAEAQSEVKGNSKDGFYFDVTWKEVV